MALIGSEVAGETWPPVLGKAGPAVDTYEVEVNGMLTRMQLSEEDAKARGAKKAAAKKAAPAKSAKKAEPKKAATPANKARTTATKRAEVASKAWQRKK